MRKQLQSKSGTSLWDRCFRVVNKKRNLYPSVIKRGHWKSTICRYVFNLYTPQSMSCPASHVWFSYYQKVCKDTPLQPTCKESAGEALCFPMILGSQAAPEISQSGTIRCQQVGSWADHRERATQSGSKRQWHPRTCAGLVTVFESFWNHNPWRIHGAGRKMLTWLGYIDGIHVTIYSSTMDPMDKGWEDLAYKHGAIRGTYPPLIHSHANPHLTWSKLGENLPDLPKGS